MANYAVGEAYLQPVPKLWYDGTYADYTRHPPQLSLFTDCR
jgi:hypothetical protein